MRVHLNYPDDINALCGAESCRGHHIQEIDGPVDERIKLITCKDCLAVWRAHQQELAEAINNATPEDIAKAMESISTDALEWVTKFEALSHRGATGLHSILTVPMHCKNCGHICPLGAAIPCHDGGTGFGCPACSGPMSEYTNEL